MRDYSERIKYYQQKAESAQKEAESMYNTIKYINYKLPSTWGILGTGYFMIASLFGIFALILTIIICQDINFLLVRNLMFVFALVSWGVCAPVHIVISKNKCHVDNRYSHMSITESKIENFKTYQLITTKNMYATVYRKVASKLKQREKIRNQINNNKSEKRNNEIYKQRCESLIKDIDQRFTTFIHNDYTIFHYFESYLTWEKERNLMEGFMCGPLFMFAWNIGNLNTDATYNNITFLLNLIIPCLIGLVAPLIVSHINFSWDKKALAQIMSTANTDIMQPDKKPWCIKNEIDDQLKELITEYVALLVEFEDC